jgi:hypothetical protein
MSKDEQPQDDAPPPPPREQGDAPTPAPEPDQPLFDTPQLDISIREGQRDYERRTRKQ